MCNLELINTLLDIFGPYAGLARSKATVNLTTLILERVYCKLFNIQKLFGLAMYVTPGVILLEPGNPVQQKSHLRLVRNIHDMRATT